VRAVCRCVPGLLHGLLHMLRADSARPVRAVLDLCMAGPDPLARSPVVACPRLAPPADPRGAGARGGGGVRYMAVDAWAARAGRTSPRDADELRAVAAAARAVAGVEVEWASGTAARWPAAAADLVRRGPGRGPGGGGGWLGVVLGDLLEMVGLARGAALVGQIAEGVRAGGWAGAVVLATSSEGSSNAALLALEIPPRRSVARDPGT
jgi:hypothetical protein